LTEYHIVRYAIFVASGDFACPMSSKRRPRMNGFHVCWDHNTDVCSVLADAFGSGSFTEDRKKEWATLIQELGGEVRPYLANARKNLRVVGATADKFITIFRKHRVRCDHDRRLCSFKTRGGINVSVLVQNRGNVRIEVQFNRDSATYATILAFKLHAHPIVLACAAAELASRISRGKKVKISYPENLQVCKICSTLLWN